MTTEEKIFNAARIVFQKKGFAGARMQEIADEAGIIRHFVEIIRMVMLKGATFSDISFQFFVIILYAFILNGLAVWSYKKVN